MSDDQARPTGSRGCLTIIIVVGAALVLLALAAAAGLAYMESLAREEERERARRKEAEERERRSRAFPTELRRLGASREARLRVYEEGGALRLDLGRLRLELPGASCSRSESFFLVIAAAADDRRLNSRSGADFEHRFERGVQRCQFKGLPFTIKDGLLNIGEESLPVAEGPPMLVRLQPRPGDPVVAVERIE